MRRDLEEWLGKIHPRDAKQLGKRDYRNALELIPDESVILGAAPAVGLRMRGPLVVTRTELIYISRVDHVAIPLAHIHGKRLSEGGLLGNDELYIYLASEEFLFAFPSAKAETVGAFIGALEWAMENPISAQPHSESSAADELAKFAALRDQGVLTDEEFDAKKAQLLA